MEVRWWVRECRRDKGMCNYITFYSPEFIWSKLMQVKMPERNCHPHRLTGRYWSSSHFIVLQTQDYKNWRILDLGWNVCFIDNSNSYSPIVSPASVVQSKSFTMSIPSHAEIFRELIYTSFVGQTQCHTHMNTTSMTPCRSCLRIYKYMLTIKSSLCLHLTPLSISSSR